MSSLPTIVLVHGAWHTPPNYQTYIDALQKEGFKVHCPRLPSCSGISPPTATLSDDVTCIRQTVQSLVETGERVLMVMHSYGGAVATSALDGLSLAERKAAGQPGGVIHLLYLCAYILDSGSTCWGVLQDAKMAHLWDQFIDTQADGMSFPKDPNLLFFSRLAEQNTVDKALPHLVRFPDVCLHTPTTGAAWKDIPTTYISTVADYSVPKIYQDVMLEKVKKAGVEVKVKTYEASHSLFITMEKEMVDEAIEAASDERNSS